MAAGGRHDQLQRAACVRITAHRHGQPVIAVRQGGQQERAPAAIGSAVHLGGGDLGQLVRRQPALVHAAGFLGEPVDGAPPRRAGRVKVTSGGSGAAITRTGASMRRHGCASASRRLSAISRALPTAAPMA